MPFVVELSLFFARLFFLFGFLAVSFGLGMFLFRPLRLRPSDPFSALWLPCGLGAWVLSQFVFGLGIAGFLSKGGLFSMLAVVSLASLISLRELTGTLRTVFESRRYFLLLLFLAASLLALSLPDLTYDSLAYHLYLPKYYLVSGRIRFLPQLMLSAFPQNMELLYLVGLAFGDDGFARVPNLLFAFLSLLLLGSVAWEVSRKRHSGFLTMVSFLTLPVVFYGTSWALVDVASGFYALGSLFCLLKGHREKEGSYFFLAGLLSAAGLGIKYLYWIHLFSLTALGVGIWIFLPQGKRYPLWKAIALFTGTAIFFGSAWYLRNLLVTGNPVYPFFYARFGGPHWSAELEKGLLAIRQQFGPAKSVANFILLPFWLLKEEGYLSFVFLPLLFLLRPRQLQWFWVLTVLCLFEAAIWFFALTFQMRYGMFWQMVWCVLLGSALASVLEQKRYSPGFRRSIAVILIAVAVFSFRPYASVSIRAGRLFFGLDTKEDVRSRYLESYPIFRYINESLPEEAKIASFGDARGYYCERPFFPIHPDVEGYIDLNTMANASAYARRLKEIGVTHLIYNPRRTEIFRNRYPHWIRLQQELEKGFLERIRKENTVTLYKLR